MEGDGSLPPLVLKGHNATVRSLKFQPRTPNSSATALLASGGAGDGAVRLWDIDRGSGAQHSVTPAPRQLCSSSFLFNVIYLGSGALLSSLAPPDGIAAPPSQVQGLAWLRDGRTVVAAYEDGTVAGYDTRRTASPAWTMPGTEGGAGVSCIGVLSGPDDDLLYVGSVDGGLTVVSARERRVVRRSEQLHSGEIRHVSVWGADGRRLVLTASSDCSAGLWDASFGQRNASLVRLADLRGHSDKALCSAFVPGHHYSSGPLSVTSGADGRVNIWIPVL